MRLPIPIFRDDKIYREVEIDKPLARVVADTRKTANSGMPNKAMCDFLKSCIVKIDDIEDKVSIASIVPYMTIRSAEYIADQVMIMFHDGDDGVEGFYECPLCETPKISILKKEDDVEIDTRDFLSDMKITYMEEDCDSIYRELIKPVTIKDKGSGQVLEEVTSIKFEHPQLRHGIAAEIKHGINDEIKFQFGLYVECLQEVNGSAVDTKWKNRYGMFFFENVREVKEDLGYISQEVSKYGRDRSFKKECHKCGKIWKAVPKTSNFFASALLSAKKETES